MAARKQTKRRKPSPSGDTFYADMALVEEAEARNEPRRALRDRKVRKWREALDALRSPETFEDLAQIESETTKKVVDNRKRVPVNEVVVAEKVFQWRGEHSSLQAEELHMRELMRGLEIRDLQAVTVFTLGDKPYLVDGHHRLAAYAALGKKSVPVIHFKGDLEAAWLKSLDANVRDKLPITRQDKYEAAFKLVKRRVLDGITMSCEDIAGRAVVSDRVVYKMQKMLKTALLKTPEARNWSWGEMQRKALDEKADYQPGSDEFRSEQARRLADQIMSAVGTNLTANPDITAIALHMISEALPPALIAEWEELVWEVLLGEAGAVESDEGDEAERALRKALELLGSARRKAAEF
jgi:hypothetical protein